MSGVLTLLAVSMLFAPGVRAFDETKFPNWQGQWAQLGGGRNSGWDPDKPAGASQQAPLTPEYQAIFAASVKAEAEGGEALDPVAACIPPAVPRVMMATEPMEIVVTPGVTYIMFDRLNALRLIYTDGRSFPDDIEPSFAGYSIGRWQDTEDGGRFDTLLIETRAIKGPHTYDAGGTPFHRDGEAVVTEKLYADRSDPSILHDEITTTDHALTRPWTVTRSYRREVSQPEWLEVLCKADTSRITIGRQSYKLSPEGLLMPAVKGQEPPNLKYFK
jgi:hypothetical protein